MIRLRFALVCALGVLLLMPPAAAGGGWWSYVDVNRSRVAPGQRVELKETVLFKSAAAAQTAQGTDQYYVYLLRGFDYSVVDRAMLEPSPRDWWSLGGAEAIQIGDVAVNVSDANLARATAAFTMPELPPATYSLMLCDAACAKPLANLIPIKRFTVVADPATARTAQRVDRLERRSRKQVRQLAAARADIDEALAAGRNARSEAERLKASVTSPANEGEGSRSAAPWAYAGWLLAGVFGGATALLLLGRRRVGLPRPARVAGPHPSDEELRELLSAESRPPRETYR